MQKQLISSGSRFEAEIGYSRAVVAGDWVFVSGTTGFDYATMAISDDVREQAAQCFKNIATALTQAGATLDDVVRVNYILPNTADFEPCWPVLRQYLGKARPAATMVSAGLLDARMKIEVEVTALRRQAGFLTRQIQKSAQRQQKPDVWAAR
ncbi:MAG: RidA family protein [Rhodoferax sp.]|nr:RidA family protein [Rhodoferax sp.]